MAKSWSRIECEAVVADYFAMLDSHLRDEPYSKAEHRRALLGKLDGRSEGAIEYKHQNISAILLLSGHVYIPGYKPAWNYQGLLEQVVLDRVQGTQEELRAAEDRLIEKRPTAIEPTDWKTLFVPAPERKPVTQVREHSDPRPQRVNYAEREARNRNLGQLGEEFVLRIEKARLNEVGRSDLADDVEWTSKAVGDGTGYDIRSFKDNTDEELFIEVKTTNSGIYQPFLLSVNEVRFSAARAKSYSLYRLFDFRGSPGIFRLNGRIDKHVLLEATQFRASFQQ